MAAVVYRDAHPHLANVAQGNLLVLFQLTGALLFVIDSKPYNDYRVKVLFDVWHSGILRHNKKALRFLSELSVQVGDYLFSQAVSS